MRAKLCLSFCVALIIKVFAFCLEVLEQGMILCARGPAKSDARKSAEEALPSRQLN